MSPIEPTLCVAHGHPSGKPFLYVTAAKKIHWKEIMALKVPVEAAWELRSQMNHYAYVHGLVLSGNWEYMTADDPSDFWLQSKWIAYKAPATHKDPTPGYDADGREVWEYP